LEYGLQLYSVRDITEKKMEHALSSVHETGYASVEYHRTIGNTNIIVPMENLSTIERIRR